jgi:hypothetical protein
MVLDSLGADQKTTLNLRFGLVGISSGATLRIWL